MNTTPVTPVPDARPVKDQARSVAAQSAFWRELVQLLAGLCHLQ